MSNSKQRARRLRQRQQKAGVIDKIFFILAFVAGLWLNIFLLLEVWSRGWWAILLALIIWAVASYLTLPRLHSILTDIYVPNYFIGRARTSDGLLGDPINLAAMGTAQQVHAAMRGAGWTLADPITASSARKMIQSTLTRKSYPEAPISPLHLFGRKQDFAYQQEVDGNPKERHHVRFWAVPKDWLLPGGHRVDWLAGGTFDKAVGLSIFTLQVTHKIDEDTDVERDHIVDTVREHIPQVKVDVLEDFSTGYHSRNGGGDQIKTDGDLPILDLREVEAEEVDKRRAQKTLDNMKAQEATGGSTDSSFMEAFKLHGNHSLSDASKITKDLAQSRPLSAFLGVVTVLASAGIGIATFAWTLWHWDHYVHAAVANEIVEKLPVTHVSEVAPLLATVGGATMAVLLGVQFLLCWRMMNGSQLARIFLMGVILAQLVLFSVGYFLSWQADFPVIVLHVGLLTIALMQLSEPDTRRFVSKRALESD
ncbi:MAG: LssY C-terminal domain-containing protein [Winkia neuii]|uniref:LssY C-terminal domain-containing protein n=1 Tax=Winkia neuii TaxID=33007 RepID=UPI0003FEFDB2|nr:LssY C-terminal domain-containing protein [Winkia neuii]MDK8100629.1 LssY C-terminal domain-containing protein [Winkia neuii]MDU3135485.1 LssY C-terminal domain-containing protein [Winkia neuii]